LPRDAYQQAEDGAEIQLKDTQPGDLAFFDNEGGKIIHVGIVLDDQQIIHAHGQVRIDKLDAEGIYNTERSYYSHKLCLIKRYL
jgi:gamma-D-glutamyl-L-lysine dipeptidyl-peptidase